MADHDVDLYGGNNKLSDTIRSCILNTSSLLRVEGVMLLSDFVRQERSFAHRDIWEPLNQESELAIADANHGSDVLQHEPSIKSEVLSSIAQTSFSPTLPEAHAGILPIQDKPPGPAAVNQLTLQNEGSLAEFILAIEQKLRGNGLGKPTWSFIKNSKNSRVVASLTQLRLT